MKFGQFSKVNEDLPSVSNQLSAEDRQTIENTHSLRSIGLLDNAAYAYAMKSLYDTKVKGLIKKNSRLDDQTAAFFPEIEEAMKSEVYRKLVELGYYLNVGNPLGFFMYGTVQVLKPGAKWGLRISGEMNKVFSFALERKSVFNELKLFTDNTDFFENAMRFIVNEIDPNDPYLRLKKTTDKLKSYDAKAVKMKNIVVSFLSKRVPENIAIKCYDQYLKSNATAHSIESLSTYSQYLVGKQYLKYLRGFLKDGKLFLGIRHYTHLDPEIESYLIEKDIPWITGPSFHVPKPADGVSLEVLKNMYLPYKFTADLISSCKLAGDDSKPEIMYTTYIQTDIPLAEYPKNIASWLRMTRYKTEDLAAASGNNVEVDLYTPSRSETWEE